MATATDTTNTAPKSAPTLGTSPAMLVKSIDIAAIDPMTWNSRVVKDDDAMAALTESVRLEGVKQPVKVLALTNGRFRLVFGGRRFTAAQNAGLKTIPAIVEPVGTDADASRLGSMLDNSIENLQRKDLTTYEIARTCAALREAKLPLADIVSKTGLSKGHASNLITIYVKMPPEILSYWAKECARDSKANGMDTPDEPKATMATTGFLRGLANLPDHAAMMAAWQTRLAQLKAPDMDALEDDDEEDEEDDSGAAAPADKKTPEKKFSVPEKRYKAVLRALKKNAAPALCRQVAAYLVGKADEIPGHIDAPETE